MRVAVLAVMVLACAGMPRAAALAAPPPEAYGPVPSEAQLRWHEMEFYGLICYGPNTYTGQAWGYGDVDPAVVDPSDLDTDQWAKAAVDGGMRGLILVAKHHDGFCLWPSKTTEYTVAASPWKDGKGDVLADLAASCRKYGLRLGVYISPWDRNHAEYGREQYVRDFHEQWREVLEYDDDLFSIWLDGANGGTGWYGGAREKRTIPKDYYRMEELYGICKAKQPQAVFFNMPRRADAVRWIGNERGNVPETHWSRFRFRELSSGKRLRGLLPAGMKDGDVWIPAEADTPFHRGWFWAEKRREMDPGWLIRTWYGTVGRGAALDLGLAPDKRGLLSLRTVEALKKLKEYLDAVFGVNLAASATVTADNVRGKDAAYAPSRMLDDRAATYWATDDGVGKATLTVDFGKPVTFDHLLMQEHIALGQRVHAFRLEAEGADGGWNTVTEGTTVGYKKVMRFSSCTAARARLTLETDAPCLTLATLGVYKGVTLGRTERGSTTMKR